MNVLVVAAHPDDELLGCGGALLRHRDCGDRISLCHLGDGVSSRKQEGAALDLAIRDRAEAASKCAGLLKAELLGLARFQDNRFDAVPLLEIIQRIEGVITSVDPDIVYTHHAGDLNVDHSVTAQAVLTALRPGCGHHVHRIFAFEVLSSTEWQSPAHPIPFLPNVFMDITKYLPAKLEALSFYEEELRDFPFPRSVEGVEHLAAYRGMQCGFRAAEAFMLLREVC